ncbi:S-phase kinase-associated protein 1-like [Armigeres subalbatus]|uniref:S-phase kinase-associated protein 1-like n=1 Tax=Armigeres subalbatus TaxID=124917 RepID=UPI002ED45780
MSTIKLQSADGEIFNVETRVAKCSKTIRTMMEDLGLGDNYQEVIPLPNVQSSTLRKVLEWANFHKDDQPALGAALDYSNEPYRRTDDICDWDREFLRVEQPVLLELVLAANYLDIEDLLDVTCKTIANMLKGRTPDQIRRTFYIENDLTPEEEDQLRKENEWCEEKY